MVRVIQECVQLDAILLPDEYIEYCFWERSAFQPLLGRIIYIFLKKSSVRDVISAISYHLGGWGLLKAVFFIG